MHNILCYDTDEYVESDNTNLLSVTETEHYENLHLSPTSSESKTDSEKFASNYPSSTNFFNLSKDASSSSDEECEEIIVHTAENMIKNDAKSKVSKNISNVEQQFWGDDICVDQWNEPEKIWKVNDTYQNDCHLTAFSDDKKETMNTGETQKRFLDESNLKINKYKPKKQKLVNKDKTSPDQSINKTPQSNLNAKSIYHIHHRIGPFISESNHNCRPPNKILIKFNSQSGTVNKIEWCSPQYSHLLLTASMDKTIKVWDVFAKHNGCLRTLSSHSKAVKYACWSKNGREILSSSYDKSAAVNDVESGKVVTRCEHDNFVSVAKYHPVNFHYFITGTYNKLVCWDSRNTERPVRNFLYKGVFGQVQDIAFLKDGCELISCSDLVCRDSADRNIMVWDFQKGVAVSNQIYQEKYTCTNLKVHPTESEFIAQTQGNYIALFSSMRPYRLNKFKRYQGHKVVGYNIGCDFSTDGRFIASGSSDGQVLFYDYKNARQVHKMNLGKNTICLDVAWHPLLYSTVGVSTWEGDIMILQ